MSSKGENVVWGDIFSGYLLFSKITFLDSNYSLLPTNSRGGGGGGGDIQQNFFYLFFGGGGGGGGVNN